jgi:hypothetical protein
LRSGAELMTEQKKISFPVEGCFNVTETMKYFHEWKGTARLFPNSESSKERLATTQLTKGFYSISRFSIFTNFPLVASLFYVPVISLLVSVPHSSL